MNGRGQDTTTGHNAVYCVLSTSRFNCDVSGTLESPSTMKAADCDICDTKKYVSD